MTTNEAGRAESLTVPRYPLKIPGALVERLRRQNGLSAGQLAGMVGTTQQTIDKIEKNVIKKSIYYPGIAEALGITPEMIASFLTRGSEFIPMELPPLEVDPSLPLYVTIGRINRSTYRFVKCPVCKIQRPPMLKGSNDAFSILMPDDSMDPEFRAGDTLLVQRAVPQPGSSYVFSDNDGNYKVRYLVAVSQDYYLVKGHCTDNTSDADADRVPISWHTHLVVCRYLHYEP